MDGDSTDPPEYIPKLLKKLKHFDIVLGARTLKGGEPLYKGIFTIYAAFIWPAFKIAGLDIKGDPLAGFRVLRKKTWQKLNLKANDFLIETEMNLNAIKLSLKIGEGPIPILKRAGGLLKSKLVRSPEQWIKIMNAVSAYKKD